MNFYFSFQYLYQPTLGVQSNYIGTGVAAVQTTIFHHLNHPDAPNNVNR
jgi:hypothetical protein